jgi:hypothetical protein
VRFGGCFGISVFEKVFKKFLEKFLGKFLKNKIVFLEFLGDFETLQKKRLNA